MNKTLEFLKSSIREKELMKVETRELVKRYQETLDDQIIVVIYFRFYNSIKFKESKKLLIDEETRLSLILETIERCLIRFDLNAKNKFSSYLINAIDYSLWTYIDCYLKRKGRDKFTISFDELCEMGIAPSTRKSIQDDKDEFEKIEFMSQLERFDLSEKELMFCKLVALTPNITMTEVAEELNMQRVSVYYLRDRLKVKLANLFLEV